MDIPASLGFNRPIVAHTALPGVLFFLSLKGKEGLSTLFEFEVELVAKTSILDIHSLIGSKISIQIEQYHKIPRFLNGRIFKLELVGREMPNSQYYIYKATVRPQIWALTKDKSYKIYQHKTVPDILKDVFDRYGIEADLRLFNSHREWEYCVQYDESTFNFVSRLMEHEGLYYWFEHKKGHHVMVVTDDLAAHKSYPMYDVFKYNDQQSHVESNEEIVTKWQRSSDTQPSLYSTVDYDFRKPSVSLDAMAQGDKHGEQDTIEVYEWIGGYQELDHGDSYSALRLQEYAYLKEIATATTTVRSVVPGYTFRLRNHPFVKENKKYLILSAKHDMAVAGYSTGTDRKDKFVTTFSCFPANIQFRAERNTPKPKTYGPQTAKVVGPAGQEIYTDKYGRVKVQFHWDRDGKSDENSSCWIRVSSPWAGGGFGGLQLPRINDEVVVDFIGGNPDRPIILGRVYNENNMPPVNLPAEANISGFRTQSVYGDSSTENHMLFIDQLGKELVDLRAQYDMIVNVLNDLMITVGNNRTETIGANLKTTVGATEERTVQSTRTTTINGLETGNYTASRVQTITGTQDTEVTSNDTFKVGGNQKTTIDGNHEETITGNDTIKVTGARDETVTAGVTETYNTKYTQTINGPTTRTITGTVTDTTTGAVTDTITGNVTSTINGSLTDHVTGTSTRNYDGAITDTLGATWTVTAAGDITFTAPTVHMVSTKNSQKWVIKSDSGDVKSSSWGLSNSNTGISNSNTMLSNSNNMLKLDTLLAGLTIYVSKTDMGVEKFDIAALSMKNTGMNAHFDGFQMKMFGFQMKV